MENGTAASVGSAAASDGERERKQGMSRDEQILEILKMLRDDLEAHIANVEREALSEDWAPAATSTEGRQGALKAVTTREAWVKEHRRRSAETRLSAAMDHCEELLHVLSATRRGVGQRCR
jgi:hypothetical protein